MPTNTKPEPDRQLGFFALMSVTLITFLANATENMPIGLLPEMSAGLNVSEAVIGLSLSGYALVVAFTATPLVALLNRYDQKKVILGSVLIYDISCLCTAGSVDVSTLLASRILGGLAHGVFWSLIGVYCANMSQEEKRLRNLSFIFAGGSLGFALGVPLATVLGQSTSWRLSFLAVSLLLTMMVVMGMKTMPGFRTAIRVRINWHDIIRLPGLFPMIAAVALVILAQFTVFTYIMEFFNLLGFSKSQGTTLLLICGIAGFVGSIIGGRITIGSTTRRTQVLYAAFAASFVALYFCPRNYLIIISILIIWRMLYALVPLFSQALTIEIGGAYGEVVSGIYVSAYNLSIGAGAMLGGKLSLTGTKEHSIHVIFMTAIACAIAGALCSLFISQKKIKRNYEQQNVVSFHA